VYPTFDLSKLNLKPLAERKHDMHVSEVKELGCPQPMENADLKEIAARIVAARKRGAAVILMMGGGSGHFDDGRARDQNGDEPLHH